VQPERSLIAVQWDILATILLTATIQSLFGVGVLLFGTPILLVLGYDFITALTILLPISLTINLLQVSKDYRHVQAPFYRQVLTLSIPCVVLCLLLVTTLKLNIGSIVGLFLIVAALKSVYAPFNRLIESLVRYERTYFIVMGIVHGLTNLGGSLLTAIIHSNTVRQRSDPRHDCRVLRDLRAVSTRHVGRLPRSFCHCHVRHRTLHGGGRKHVPGYRTAAL
jgi:hypothetical protein